MADISFTDLPIRLPLDMAENAGTEQRYPVDKWNPPHCGHSGMRIDAEGRWWHEGRPIARPALARLFARLLRREADGRHVLVTPVEMLDIDVDDAPLIASEVESEGVGKARTLCLRLALLDDWVTVDSSHPIRMEEGERGPRPYLDLDHRLSARIDRPAYYALAELALSEDNAPPGLWSDGVFFPLESAA
jgi:hypothetical protein